MDTQVVMDADLKKVCEFMQRNIAANRLVSVAENVGALAPILWRQFNREPVVALSLREPDPT